MMVITFQTKVVKELWSTADLIFCNIRTLPLIPKDGSYKISINCFNISYNVFFECYVPHSHCTVVLILSFPSLNFPNVILTKQDEL